MLNEEEIRLRLGLDDKPLDEGTRRALANLAKLGKESHKAFYEHGERPTRAFHKALRELTNEFGPLGGAARIALSPIGGTLAVAVTAAVAFHENLKKIHEMLDRIGKITGAPIGNIFAAKRTAESGNSDDRRRAQREMESFSDPLADLVANAQTAEERRNALNLIEGERHKTAARVIGYNSNFSERDKDRLLLAKREEDLKSLQSHLDQVKSVADDTRASATTWERAKQGGLFEKAMAGLEYGSTVGESMVGKSINELAEAAIPRLKRAIEKEEKQRIELTNRLKDEDQAHAEDVDKLKKFDEARQKLLDANIHTAELQRVYNASISVALRNRNEITAGPFTPGLSELATYRGPYAAIAREVLLGRDLAKRQLGFATPGEIMGLNAEIRGIQYDAGNELRGATTYQGRQAALRKYSERLQGLLTGHITPERQLEAINDEIKKLNEKASSDGLVVRGADNS